VLFEITGRRIRGRTTSVRKLHKASSGEDRASPVRRIESGCCGGCARARRGRDAPAAAARTWRSGRASPCGARTTLRRGWCRSGPRPRGCRPWRACSRRRLSEQPESAGGLAPHADEVPLHRLEPLVVEPVNAPGAVRFLLDEPRFLQQPEVARYGRSADRQLERERPDRARRVAEERQDLTTMWIAERVEWVSPLPLPSFGNHLVTVAMRLPMRSSSLDSAGSDLHRLVVDRPVSGAQDSQPVDAVVLNPEVGLLFSQKETVGIADPK
jgi:hypothetical protein